MQISITSVRELLADLRAKPPEAPKPRLASGDGHREVVRYALWIGSVRAEAERRGVEIEYDLLLRASYAADTGPEDAVEEYMDEHGL